MENLLDEIPLLNVPETGDAPPERLKNPKAGRDIYTKFREDDEANAYNRHLTQDLLDGGLPYDAQNLTENGVDATNLNFGGAEEQLEKARKPYYKLIQSPEKLISLNTLFGAAEDRTEWNDVLAEEITRTIRGGDDFWFESCKLCDRFIWDGISFLYWSDARDFRFKSGSLGKFFFERGTVPIETKHDVIPFIEEMTVTQLYGYIRNEEAAARNHWNVAAVRKAITKATSNQPNFMDWEKWTQEVKNNDLSLNQAPRVRLLHLFVKEFDGTMSHYITSEEPCGDEKEEDWMYSCRRKHKSMSSGLVMFPYGLGTNSTIHGIRGLGYKIYEIIHQQNRSACRLIDQGMLASTLMLSAKTEEAYGNIGYQVIGNSAVLAPDIEVATVTMPDLQRSVVPALDLMDNFLGKRTRGYTSENAFGGDQRKTKYEVEASLEQHAALSDVEQDFFFNPYERAMRECVRRMMWKGYTKLDPGGEEVVDLINRLEERGVPKEAFYKIDLDSIKVVRIVGAGSASAKTLSLQRLEALRPRMDDVGQANLDRDLAVDAAGSANADRYFPIDRMARLTLDTSIAILQNTDLMDGVEIPVLPTDRHLAQAREHIKPLLELYQLYETRQLDEEGVLAQEAVRHQLLYNHTSEHVTQIEGDPATMEEAAGFREILQRVGEIIGNGVKEAQRLAEEQAEEAGGEYAGPTPEQIAETERHREKLRQDQASFDLKQKLMAEESANRRAIADAEAAAKIKRERRVASAKAVTDTQVTKAKAAAPAKKPAKKA